MKRLVLVLIACLVLTAPAFAAPRVQPVRCGTSKLVKWTTYTVEKHRFLVGHVTVDGRRLTVRQKRTGWEEIPSVYDTPEKIAEYLHTLPH